MLRQRLSPCWRMDERYPSLQNWLGPSPSRRMRLRGRNFAFFFAKLSGLLNRAVTDMDKLRARTAPTRPYNYETVWRLFPAPPSLLWPQSWLYFFNLFNCEVKISPMTTFTTYMQRFSTGFSATRVNNLHQTLLLQSSVIGSIQLTSRQDKPFASGLIRIEAARRRSASSMWSTTYLLSMEVTTIPLLR